ncbi:MAG: large conductance mechanosensitive channel protein MscL [Blautia sp.]|jgi:large conductance mechanosensitive channel
MAKKGFISEFKDFISRGNVMDMAVGVIIGGAFSGIVTSLTEDIISPILGLFGGMNFDQLSVNILGEVTLNYGKFITAVVNFLIMALIIFFIMKAVNALEAEAAKLAHLKKEEEAPAPTTKICPYCKSEIPIDATRCAHCTSELNLEQE